MQKKQRNINSKIDKALKSDSNFEEEPSNSSETDAIRFEKIRKNNQDKPLKIFGTICIAIGIASFFFFDTGTVNQSESAINALKNKVSTGVSAGVILLAEDENIGKKDYTITHTSTSEQTKIWIWDFAAEDGDYVQVLVNGTPTSDPFMIKHKPRVMKVPSVGTVQVKGIRDGGGGITYAIRYDLNGTSYFNGAPEGEFNTYELTR